ncbi:MAG: hypothetical protein ACTHYN_13745 [Marinobacter sp.]|uniref:hypothetical protein n=1 Tax=Marinobacter sp. TaxID=50741 RepID=UPI003F972A43
MLQQAEAPLGAYAILKKTGFRGATVVRDEALVSAPQGQAIHFLGTPDTKTASV